jgi:hypothetical protein
MHTLLWLPRAFQMRRELRVAEENAAAELEKTPAQKSASTMKEEGPDA